MDDGKSRWSNPTAFVSVYPADAMALNVIEYEQWNVAHFYDFSSRPACNLPKVAYSMCVAESSNQPQSKGDLE